MELVMHGELNTNSQYFEFVYPSASYLLTALSVHGLGGKTPLLDFAENTFHKFGFMHMLFKIKQYHGVECVSISLPERDDALHIYIIMNKENLNTEENINKIFCNWITGYGQYPELHIMPRDMMHNPEMYIPADALRVWKETGKGKYAGRFSSTALLEAVSAF